MALPNDTDLRDLFQRDGYVRIDGFLDADEVRDLREHLARFVETVIPRMPPKHVFYEDKSSRQTLKQVQQIHRHDEYFGRMFEEGRFASLAEALLGAPVVPYDLQYFNKPAGVGQPTPPHQDGYYFMIEPCEAVTMWLALEKVDDENGCVRYIPGSHLEEIRPHGRSGTLGFSRSLTDFGRDGETGRELAMHAEPGDLLVHHALTVHRADGNFSPTRSRKAMGLVYFSARAKEDRGAKEEYQKALFEENVKAGKI